MSLLVVLITSKGKQLFLPREWACQFVELWSCTCVCGCMKERACSCGFMYAYLQEVYTEVVNRLAMYVCKIHTTFQSCITANGNSCWTLMWSTLSFFFFFVFPQKLFNRGKPATHTLSMINSCYQHTDKLFVCSWKGIWH